MIASILATDQPATNRIWKVISSGVLPISSVGDILLARAATFSLLLSLIPGRKSHFSLEAKTHCSFSLSRLLGVASMRRASRGELREKPVSDCAFRPINKSLVEAPGRPKVLNGSSRASSSPTFPRSCCVFK